MHDLAGLTGQLTLAPAETEHTNEPAVNGAAVAFGSPKARGCCSSAGRTAMLQSVNSAMLASNSVLAPEGMASRSIVGAPSARQAASCVLARDPLDKGGLRTEFAFVCARKYEQGALLSTPHPFSHRTALTTTPPRHRERASCHTKDLRAIVDHALAAGEW